MSARENIEAINDARALLAAMCDSGCALVHVRTDVTKIMLSRAARPAQLLTDTQTTSGRNGTETPEIAITSPHVATLIWVAPNGAVLCQGDPVAGLDVLGDEIVLRAPADGHITGVQAVVGDLLEYAFPIAVLSER